ncbi:MAG: transglycosylase SLT domain-containing protein [Synergistaceae bacterium]|nr:transglycosylase SLT domain-containing protein [Synergistaceae bacterium]
MILKRVGVCVCLFLTFSVFCMRSAGAAEVALSELFRKRSWAAMDEVYLFKKNPEARDHALMANALRIQNRWSEAVDILEKHAASFPAEVKPYADMTLLLGYEKLERREDGLRLAAVMEKNAPADLRYYVAYAQYRLLGDGNPEATEKALSRMLATAESKDRKVSALSYLIKLSGDQTANALKLLEEQPTNKAAYDILSAKPKPWSTAVILALGEYSYRQGDNKTALARLSAVPEKGPGWRKATYYRAFSLERLKRYADALKLFSSLALSGNGYAESSARRIATIAGKAGKADKANAMAALRKVLKERKGKVQVRAMYLLADLVGGKEAQEIEDGLMRAYPDSAHIVKILWKRGWDAWNAKKFEEALTYWKRVYSPGLNASWRPRVLYWIGAAQMSLGREKEAEKAYAELARNYPLSYYAFLIRPSVDMVEGDPPRLVSKPSLLEQWGFIYYAKLKMQASKAPPGDLYRSITLSEWLGEEEGSYIQARLLSRYFAAGRSFYRKGLELLYPRPFKKQVDAACEKFGVVGNLVWSVMRQESAFRPGATSHAGASGLMQLMPATARDEAKRIGLAKYDIYDVTDNINMGTAHLARLGRTFAREDRVMAAYNAGSGNARKWLADGGQELAPDFWIERVRFDETCDYVQKVSGNLAVYRLLYGEGKPASADAGGR